MTKVNKRAALGAAAVVLALGGVAGLVAAFAAGADGDGAVRAVAPAETPSSTTTPFALAPTTRPAPTSSTSTTLPATTTTSMTTTTSTAPPPTSTAPPPTSTAPAPTSTTRPAPIDWRAVVPTPPPGGTATARDISGDTYVIDIAYPSGDWAALVDPIRAEFEAAGWLATPQPGEAGTAIVVVRAGLQGQVSVGPRDGGSLVVYDLRRDGLT